MTNRQAVAVLTVCLGLAAAAGCGDKAVPDGAKPGGLSADEMKKGRPAPPPKR